MNIDSQTLIKALGGTTAVARLVNAPVSTVQSWKKNGIPHWRQPLIEAALKERQQRDEKEGRAA